MIQDLPNEEWQPVFGYEDKYSISNKGRVKSHNKQWAWNESRWKIITKKEEHILMPSITSGYYRLSLCKDGKVVSKRIHRLVAEAFLSNPENKPQVNHKDGNKFNNTVSNLEWATSKENIGHASKIGLMPKGANHHSARKVKCDTLDIEFVTIAEAANVLGFSHKQVWTTLNNNKFLQGLSFRYL